MLGLILLFTSGCWDKREMDTLTINSAIGFDQIKTDGETKVLLSVLTLKPSLGSGNGYSGGGMSGDSGQQQTTTGQVISVTGDTIIDAEHNWNQRSSRQLFMGHTKIFVIGESTAKEGIGWVLDFAARNCDIPERTMVIVCEGRAQDFLQAQSEFEPQLSAEVFDMLSLNQLFTAKTRRTDIITVMYDLLTPGREPSIVFFKTVTPPEKGSEVRLTPPASGENGDSEDEQPQQKIPKASGVVAFRGEKLVGRLKELETQGMLLIIGEVYEGVISVAFDSAEKNTSFLFRDVKTKIKPSVKNDEIAFQVEIKGIGELSEAAPHTIDITKPSGVEKIEKLINQEVEHRCQSAVSKAQELQSDVFGFGDKLHRTQPEVWKELENRWEEVFPYVKVEIKADFTLEHSGLINKSLEIR